MRRVLAFSDLGFAPTIKKIGQEEVQGLLTFDQSMLRASFALLTRSHQGLPNRVTLRSMISSPARGSASPPAKRLRESSPGVQHTSTNGNSSQSRHPIDSAQKNASLPVTNDAISSKSAAKEQKEAARRLHNRLKNKRKERQRALEKTGEEPIFYDICEMLGIEKVNAILEEGPSAEWEEKFGRREEVTLQIDRLSAHGDGLAIAPSGDWVVAVPQCLPGEEVLARVYSNERLHSKADLVRIMVPAAEGSQQVARRSDLVGCKYFGECAGCQYQMIDYGQQLEMKRNVVSKAFKNYAMLLEDQLPTVLPTLPSPLQYNYRTKLTPHFELPRELRKPRGKGKAGQAPSSSERATFEVNIGFHRFGGKDILDIEECPIATRTINAALPAEMDRIRSTIKTFKNGATLLFRDSLCSFDSPAEDRDIEQKAETEVISDHKAVVKERVGDVKFESPAGTFFQNNRSILPSLIGYVQEQVNTFNDESQENYLVDAYCGSGLFAICLAKSFARVAGIEISQDSIRFAKQNASLNGAENVDFIAGDAQEIFKVGQVSIDSFDPF
jgi:tRNA (uracil-5-)-methyltransferase